MSKLSIITVLLVILFVGNVSASIFRKPINFKLEASADNEYTLFLNGKSLLSGNKWEKKQSTSVGLQNGDIVVVQAKDYDSLGGLIVEIYNDQYDFSTGVSTWYCRLGKVSPILGFIQFGNWPVAVKAPYSEYYGVSKRQSSNWVWTSTQQEGFVTCATRISIRV